MSGLRPSTSAASQRRREAILGATRELLLDRGVEKVAVADVAERAGVSVATIYNLIGTRDRLLVALLDDAIEQVRDLLEKRPSVGGIDACVEVITTACEVALSDAETVRQVLSAVGAVAPDQWLIDGIDRIIGQRVDAAHANGQLGDAIPSLAISRSLLLGFRGALISWAFGQLPDTELAVSAELVALNVLASAAAPSQRAEITDRLTALSNSAAFTNDTRRVMRG